VRNPPSKVVVLNRLKVKQRSQKNSKPGSARIFPYSTDAISGVKAARMRDSGNRRFAIVRSWHEGISRLFEMRRTIPQVAAVSGHRSWTNLKRYTHIRQGTDKYENWKWKVRLGAD